MNNHFLFDRPNINASCEEITAQFLIFLKIEPIFFRRNEIYSVIAVFTYKSLFVIFVLYENWPILDCENIFIINDGLSFHHKNAQHELSAEIKSLQRKRARIFKIKEKSPSEETE